MINELYYEKKEIKDKDIQIEKLNQRIIELEKDHDKLQDKLQDLKDKIIN